MVIIEHYMIDRALLLVVVRFFGFLLATTYYISCIIITV